MFISAPRKNNPSQKQSLVKRRQTMTNFQIERTRILLIDDDDDARDLATLTLKEYALICAGNFDEGLRLAQEENFKLFILDSRLLDRSGVELCRAIREFDANTPILFYSGAAFKRDIEEAILAGAQAYLTKPTTPNELRQEIARLISYAPKTPP
jgi:DNA-binding response OmpR family regulator